MKIRFNRLQYLSLTIIFTFTAGCTNNVSSNSERVNFLSDNEAAFNYLKGLEGKWLVQGGEEGVFGWEFDLTSRQGVIIERLKVGTPSEMSTVYYLNNGILVGNHYCQLQNQPKLNAVKTEADEDLYFLCNGEVGNTQSHNELHMHGVHFKKNDKSLVIWMDMVEDGEIAFETRYELFKVDSEMAQELTNLED